MSNLRPDDLVEYKTVALERLAFHWRKCIDRLELAHSVQPEAIIDVAAQSIAMGLTAKVFAEKTSETRETTDERKEVTDYLYFPATWWDAVKVRFAWLEKIGFRPARMDEIQAVTQHITKITHVTHYTLRPDIVAKDGRNIIHEYRYEGGSAGRR